MHTELLKAVHAFSRMEVEAICRKVIHRLQRQPASGIFGGDYSYKSIWDEFCNEVQEGPYSMLGDAWYSLIARPIADLVSDLPKESAVLMTFYALEVLDEDDKSLPPGALWPEGIAGVVELALRRQAANRNIEHLGPFREP
ncbi:MAG: hypothetical protein AAF384_09230 [Pseudomonadota bacterium]